MRQNDRQNNSMSKKTTKIKNKNQNIICTFMSDNQQPQQQKNTTKPSQSRSTHKI